MVLTSIDTGDGFGGAGQGGKRISLDTEGLVLGKDGSFWISDEYGMYFKNVLSAISLIDWKQVHISTNLTSEGE